MTDFNSIFQTVTAENRRKSDVTLNFKHVIPKLLGEKVVVREEFEEVQRPLTKRGLSSYLERIKVPHGFFGRCSQDLKERILLEHHERNQNQKVLARLYDNEIRYMGSEKYGVFDDIDVVDALASVNELHELTFREFSQSLDHFVMRATAKNPIEAPNGRPFFPGIQIQNSETGLGAINIQFLLWEQICTNGITVPRGVLKSFTKKHLGNAKKDKDSLKHACKELVLHLPTFIDSSHRALKIMADLPEEDLLEDLTEDTRIPKAVREEIKERIPNFTPPNMKPTSLEVLSAYTEAIQKYTWDTRSQLEDIAGEYMFA